MAYNLGASPGSENVSGAENQGFLPADKVMANLTSVMSRATRAFLVYSNRFDLETIRKMNAGEIKIRDANWVHHVRLRPNTGSGSVSLIRSDNKRRPGISDFSVNKLPAGVNVCVGGLSFGYGLSKNSVQTPGDDDAIEAALVADTQFHHQKVMPAMATYNYQGPFDTSNTELVTLVPTFLQKATLTIKQANVIEWQGLVEEMLLGGWNAPTGPKRDGCLQLEKPFMLYEDKDISIDLTYPTLTNGTGLPQSITTYSTHPGAPAATIVYPFCEHFAQITFHGAEGAPIK